MYPNWYEGTLSSFYPLHGIPTIEHSLGCRLGCEHDKLQLVQLLLQQETIELTSMLEYQHILRQFVNVSLNCILKIILIYIVPQV